jgi:glycosyltransferase involved in cell wall biosynthesis
MKLLVHEPNNKGHFLHSARLIAEAAIARGIVTEISVRAGAPATPDFKLHMGPIMTKLAAVNTFELPAGGTLTALSAASGRACIEIAAQRGAEHILVPAADGVAPMLALRSWGGLRRTLPKGAELEVGLIRPRFAHAGHRGARRAKMALVRWAISRAPIGALRIADFPAYERMKGMAWARRQRLLAVPEPCEPTRPFSREEARAFLGLPTEGRLVVAPGEISSRKCPLELATAFSGAAEPDDCLLFAGPCVDGLHERLRERFRAEMEAGRIMVIDRLLTDEELDAAIAAADVVAAVYSGHPGPSGIVDRAMMMDRPVLAHNYGWSEYMVRRFNLGWTADPHNAEAYGAAVRAALARAGDYRPPSSAGWLKSFFGMENFKRHWMMRIRERMGLPPEELVTWDDAPDAAR